MDQYALREDNTETLPRVDVSFTRAIKTDSIWDGTSNTSKYYENSQIMSISPSDTKIVEVNVLIERSRSCEGRVCPNVPEWSRS